MYNPKIPYNNLPLLPPNSEIETKEVLKAVVLASRALSELKGKGNEIPNQTMLINAITLQEAKDSSEIENIMTTHDSLYKAFSSEKNNIDPYTKEVLRYKEALWKGYQTLDKRPLTTNSFVSIVQTIKENDFDIRNTSGTRIVSNGKTIYTPPGGENVIRNLLHNLEQFIHNEDKIDVLVRLAVMHYQFEAIHPFLDGNGRTGRIINILYLVEKGLLDMPILYLSRYIVSNKNEYYKRLRNVTENEDWEPWILYMLKGIEETALYTVKKINDIKELMEQTIDVLKENNVPSRISSLEFINLLFEQPYCKTKFLVDRGLSKRQSASQYLKTLENIGILKSYKVGRETLFLNIKLFELLSKF